MADRVQGVWRTTAFRLTLLYGALFAVAVMALTGLVYWRTADFLSRQADQIVVVSRFRFTRDETLETKLSNR